MSAGNPFNPWNLESGTWLLDPTSDGYMLTMTAGGKPPSSLLGPDDFLALMEPAYIDGSQSAAFPPEFKFSPQTGKSLHRQTRPGAGCVWVPPFGSATVGPRVARGVRGLRQVARALKLTRKSERRSTDDADAELSPPPPGVYEYFSTPACSHAEVLLAIDPAKGLLYALMPGSKRWEPLEHPNGHLLAEWRCDRVGWRSEVDSDGFLSRIFLPTDLGLACIRPDALSLTFEVSYAGDAPAVGAPLQFGEQIWAPLLVDGGIRFVSTDMQGVAAEQVDLSAAMIGAVALGPVHPPLADGNKAFWLCAAGQLLLHRYASGEVRASFQPWPAGVRPAFEFGCPYLSRDGGLWQLCFDSQLDLYVYVQLGIDNPQRAEALAPRLCSGSFNFRFGTKFKNEPWIEPEHSEDGSSDEVLLPLLESTIQGSVLGLQLNTNDGLAEVLRSGERIRALLVLDDESNRTVFHEITVLEPWRLRFFVHSGMLWAYLNRPGNRGGHLV